MASYRQEKPPPGGYPDIQWAKAVTKKLSGWKLLGGFAAFQAFGLIYYIWFDKKRSKDRLEVHDWRISLSPFYTAEQDRELLKAYRSMRDEEELLMKDTPGWKVGTLYGQELFHDDRNRFNEQVRFESIAFLHAHERNPALKAKIALGLEKYFGF